MVIGPNRSTPMHVVVSSMAKLKGKERHDQLERQTQAFMTMFIGFGIFAGLIVIAMILGSLGTAPLDLAGLGHMVSLIPAGSVWSVGGVGRFQLDANVMAMAAGGHVRVGLEDNIYFDRGRTDLADNARLVERVARIARDMGREPASPEEARQIIGLSVG